MQRWPSAIERECLSALQRQDRPLRAGQLSFGTGSIPGAVRDVRIQYGLVRYETIGRKPPVGICGSGLCVSHFGDEKESDDG